MANGTGAKKAQIVEQVFIFILAGLVFILIISIIATTNNVASVV